MVECKRCLCSALEWKQRLTVGSHGCAVCKDVFVAKTWTVYETRKHEGCARDLVCPGCRELGYAPGKYVVFECEECLKKLGRGKFEKCVLQNSKRCLKSRLLCRDCQAFQGWLKQMKYRCGKCEMRYDTKYWSKAVRDKQGCARAPTLVCKACRARGFHPLELKSYHVADCVMTRAVVLRA